MTEHAEITKKRIFSFLKEKMRSRTGTTLVETLCAILVMAILGGAICTGMLVSAQQYTKSVRSFEKDMLYSTLQYVISYELQYSTSITIDESSKSVIDVQAKTYGEEMYYEDGDEMGEEVDEICRTFFADDKGRIVYGIENSNVQSLLSKNAYPDDMTARVDTLTYDPDSHYFHVVLSILYKKKPVVDRVGFDVLNLYSTEPKLA